MSSIKRAISLLLVLCLSLTGVVVASADDVAETYISELRIIYAENYESAKSKLAETEFSNYQVLNYNLNSNTGKIGTWLAYETTTNVDDAITDLAVMQMNGGYKEGNYQELIRQSFEEYTQMSETYLIAINYFAKAYKAGDFLAQSAYRQLNFYCDTDTENCETLGEMFVNGIDAPHLATIFMEGNTHALNNVRSLIAQGVSYNENGKHYLENVSSEAKLFTHDPSLYSDSEYYETAKYIVGTLITFREMFNEYEAVEDELNYDDDEYTKQEIQYVEYSSMAERLRKVEYLNGESLYEFCFSFNSNSDDLSPLYPLAAALNEGQVAMTKLAHYYDVVRYSMSDYPEKVMDSEIKKQEEIYGEIPFNIYEGVDRSVYTGTFAITTQAYRADAVTETGLLNNLLNKKEAVWRGLEAGSAVVSLGVFIFNRQRNKAIAAEIAEIATEEAVEELQSELAAAVNNLSVKLSDGLSYMRYTELLDYLIASNRSLQSQAQNLIGAGFLERFDVVNTAIQNGTASAGYYSKDFRLIQDDVLRLREEFSARTSQRAAEKSTEISAGAGNGMFSAGMYFLSAATAAYTAVSLFISVYNYYYPDYDDIPVAMVDMFTTVDGDRYIKYNVVYEAVAKDDGKYAPADLNAFKAKRWNALYYTKSYEAGKPLNDSFKLSLDSNVPRANHLPVHLFGEKICYDLNKYNGSGADNLYLSVKQSETQKTAISNAPQVVGSLISDGVYFLMAGIGIVAGVGLTLGVQLITKKKKSKEVKEN